MFAKLFRKKTVGPSVLYGMTQLFRKILAKLFLKIFALALERWGLLQTFGGCSMLEYMTQSRHLDYNYVRL